MCSNENHQAILAISNELKQGVLPSMALNSQGVIYSENITPLSSIMTLLSPNSFVQSHQFQKETASNECTKYLEEIAGNEDEPSDSDDSSEDEDEDEENETVEFINQMEASTWHSSLCEASQPRSNGIESCNSILMHSINPNSGWVWKSHSPKMVTSFLSPSAIRFPLSQNEIFSSSYAADSLTRVSNKTISFKILL